MVKVLTWVDLQGRYRVTSLPYGDPTNPVGETEAEMIERVWAKTSRVPKYGLPSDHPYHVVDNDAQLARLKECCGLYFRYPVQRSNDLDEFGEVRPEVCARYGWEMDTDGRPKVNMPKARAIHMDRIRQVRDAELAKLDVPFMRAVEVGDLAEQQRIGGLKQTLRNIPQTFDLTKYRTPTTLKAAWPQELPSP